MYMTNTLNKSKANQEQQNKERHVIRIEGTLDKQFAKDGGGNN